MRVHKIAVNLGGEFRMLGVERGSPAPVEPLVGVDPDIRAFTGNEVASADWTTPTFRPLPPKHKPSPDFWQVAGVDYVYVVSQAVLRSSCVDFRSFSQLLPVIVGEETHWLVNVVPSRPECLDESRVRIKGAAYVTHYAFVPDLIPTTGLFRIGPGLFCGEGADNPASFRKWYQDHSFGGLTFVPVWDSEHPVGPWEQTAK